MNYELNNVAVLLAGGSGQRMGADRPKQFLEVLGKTILEWSILAFSRVERISGILIVSRPDLIDEVRQIVARGGYQKVRQVLPGGSERYDSSLAAIRYLTKQTAPSGQGDDAQADVRLLLHDAVRPLVSERTVNDVIDALEQFEAVDVAVPSTDTIIEVDAQGTISRMPARSQLRNVQTPQGFRLSTIRRAYERALQDPDFQSTDDCGVVFRYLPDVRIKVVEGEATNIKITYPQDLLTMQQVLKGRL